jgi:flagellar hook protein FlgE
MSLYGAMFSGVSGLAAQSQVMGTIADNITNVNTIGFKRTLTNLSTQVTASGVTTAYAPGGVQARPLQLVDQQGLLQASTSPTDIAMSGDGFYVVNSSPSPTASTGTFTFTRAGSFVPDKNGALRNAAGQYLQGVAIPSTGIVPANPTALNSLSTVNIYALNNNWVASTAVSAVANLISTQPVHANIANYGYPAAGIVVNMSSGTIPPDFSTAVQVYDSKGSARTVTMGFLKAAAANVWHVEMYVTPAADANPGGAPTHPDSGRILRGTITFNPTGTFNSAALTDGAGGALGAGGVATINWAAALGLAQSQIAFDVTKFTQAASPSRLISSTVDGAILGSLAGVQISRDGIVSALFDNGKSTPIYKIPIANFRNPNGMVSQNGNTFLATDESGPFTLLDAGKQGAGFVAAGSLESSTVDLAQEFSNMIVTQRAYSASGKIITTADEMLDELIRLKR